MINVTNLRLAGAAAAVATLISGAVSAETIRLAHWVPPAHTLTASTIAPLQEAVAGSGLEIQVYPGGELGAGPLEQYARVLTGVADVVWGLQGYTSSQFPRTMISELPGALPEGMNGYDMIYNAYVDLGEGFGIGPLIADGLESFFEDIVVHSLGFTV